MLPLELGGRRPARIAVAEREVEIREREVANNERMLAAEVRMKFGEALAQSFKLSLTDERIESNQQSFNLVAARVIEGATPPGTQPQRADATRPPARVMADTPGGVSY